MVKNRPLVSARLEWRKKSISGLVFPIGFTAYDLELCQMPPKARNPPHNTQSPYIISLALDIHKCLGEVRPEREILTYRSKLRS